jgi:hypothetical protein
MLVVQYTPVVGEEVLEVQEVQDQEIQDSRTEEVELRVKVIQGGTVDQGVIQVHQLGA